MPGKRYAVGVLFVHGMGEQERGDTITQAGDALTEWLRRWLTHASQTADFKIWKARLRTAQQLPSDTADQSFGGQAHVSVAIIDTGDRPKPTQEWLLAESWWAGAFRSASFTELVAWAISVGPWLIASQVADITDRFRVVLRSRILVTLIWIVLALIAAVLAAILTPLVLGLLVVSLVPIPGVSDIARGLAKNLSGSFGDLLVLVRSPVRFAAMAEQVRGDIARLYASCDRVMVVAHSQGSAVSWHAIRRAAQRPLDEQTPVARFLSYGQAFRKLKSLHRLHLAGGMRQFVFAALAFGSTLALVMAAYFGAGAIGDFVDVQADLGEVAERSTTRLHWLWLGASLALVVLLQWRLGLMAQTNDREAEVEVKEEFANVRTAFGDFEWLDLWASADPAPNGPLLSDLPAGVDTYKVRNVGSTLLDHSVYWANTTEFVSAVAFSAASLAPRSAIGVKEPVPPVLRTAAAVRDSRVSMRVAGKMLMISGYFATLIGARRELPDWGEGLLNALNAIPLLPDWFGGWPPVLKGFVAAGLMASLAVILWAALVWGWSAVTRADERALFARTISVGWSWWARGWMLAAAAVPTVAVAVLSIYLTDAAAIAWYVIIAVVAVGFALLILSPGGRRLGQPGV